MNTLLECNTIIKKYSDFYALNEVSLTLERGRIVGLLGPNGSGKTTLLKLINGLLVPDSGSITIAGFTPGTESKKIISYLPERTYLAEWMTVKETIQFFQDFYADFDSSKAYDMLSRLQIDSKKRLKAMSKGTKEKVQLILVMSRKADLYCLDEPIGGVDPASRDYILNTIISNYNENATVLISTHLIADIENVLDEVIFIKDGKITLHSPVDEVRTKEGKSIDSLFREVFKC
ncbi:ABC transporter ATP-binding protein [Anaerocolumna sp. AGMB13025]|uniref:ABC transporter ATP-binding protein n=1 Tax=Anaerocolumna sp. AGMB13025 TaxID=3039116 RepID=UPI00241DCBBB|nr:ABC transporter ATP-binding protein [Anaerocolumna sp. AGMB13025]WFR60200.1 ABC transporter ATP-binding protein [Anaerocolumna sp. AGMB13025]